MLTPHRASSPPPMVGDYYYYVVAGQRSSIVATSANHSKNATAASAGDNDDDDDKANKPSPQAGLDTDWGGRRQPDDHLASTRQESVSSNAHARGSSRKNVIFFQLPQEQF